MASLRRRVLALIACSVAILFCSLMLVGAAYASSIPPDPIIDMEGVTCDTGCAVAQLAAATTGSDFMISFTFPTTNCTSDGVMSCSATQNFMNAATAIANMEFVINTFNSSGEQVDINQGGFFAPSPSTNPRAYQVFSQNPNGIEAIYTAPANPSFEIAPNQNFFAMFAGVLIPNGGRAVVHMTANVPLPEPSSIALLAASLPAAFLLRRKKQL